MPEGFLAQLDPLLGLALLASVGVAAGVINTIAGGGSLVVLPVLMGLGLPATVANGTARVGVIVQNLSATATFHRQGVREYPLVLRLALPMIIGSALGALLATRLSDATLRPVIGVVLAAWAILLVARPGNFSEPPSEPRSVGWLALVFSLAIGVYGGFLQGGVGFPLLALLVSYLGHPPVRANATKVVLVFAYTAVALPLFAIHGMVAWREGGSLAVGTMLGAWIGARWQLRSGAKLVRWVVAVAVAISGAAMLATGWTG